MYLTPWMSKLSHTETLECQLFVRVILRTTGSMATHYSPALGKSIIPQITSLGKDQNSKQELDVVFYLCNPSYSRLRHETLQFENILSAIWGHPGEYIKTLFQKKKKSKEREEREEDPPSVVSIPVLWLESYLWGVCFSGEPCLIQAS